MAHTVPSLEVVDDVPEKLTTMSSVVGETPLTGHESSTSAGNKHDNSKSISVKSSNKRYHSEVSPALSLITDAFTSKMMEANSSAGVMPVLAPDIILPKEQVSKKPKHQNGDHKTNNSSVEGGVRAPIVSKKSRPVVTPSSTATQPMSSSTSTSSSVEQVSSASETPVPLTNAPVPVVVTATRQVTAELESIVAAVPASSTTPVTVTLATTSQPVKIKEKCWKKRSHSELNIAATAPSRPVAANGLTNVVVTSELSPPPPHLM